MRSSADSTHAPALTRARASADERVLKRKVGFIVAKSRIALNYQESSIELVSRHDDFSFVFDRGFHQSARVEELRLAQPRPYQLQARYGHLGVAEWNRHCQRRVARKIHGHR